MNLNLARKWRSKTFDQIVGQELSVRMLKNSLYLDRYFPVYLFSGQRGCGKTTTARVFAAAVNCFNLYAFQKDPKNSLMPCLVCDSCLAIAQGRHPDFIEIDAASHTGVDNVRNIIEAASLLPILGTKKIYLIDEAHMLSKAACNAFLKILEEPPHSVFFILATTDVQKIPATVTSRCFQLFFSAIDSSILSDHLRFVCKQESIEYEEGALELISKHSQGSARDALNLLEQIRFSTETITHSSVQALIGSFSDDQCEALLDILLDGTVRELVSWLSSANINAYSASMIWESLLEKIRCSVWKNYGIVPQGMLDKPYAYKKEYSTSSLSSLLEVLYSYELLFMKTSNQHRLLETIWFSLCRVRQNTLQEKVIDRRGNHEQKEAIITKNTFPEKDDLVKNDPKNIWDKFLAEVEILKDPLVLSIFKQGTFLQFHEQSGSVEVHFPKNVSFFQDLLEGSSASWKPILTKIFSAHAYLSLLFIEESIVSLQKEKGTIAPSVADKKIIDNSAKVKGNIIQFPRQARSKDTLIDVSDEQTWKQANMIVKIFPGNITEIQKGEHE